MVKQLSAPLIKLIRQLKEAILRVDEDLQREGVRVDTVEFDLQTTCSSAGGVEVGLKALVPLEAAQNYSRENVHTIHLKLKPQAALELSGDVDRQLAQAVRDIGSAAKEAALLPPAFGLEAASVTLYVSTAKEGKLSVIAVGEFGSKTAHKITVNLVKA